MTAAADQLNRPTVAVLALAALGTVPVAALAGVVAGGVRPGLVVVLAVVAAAEGVTANRVMTDESADRSRMRRFRVAEIAMIFLVVRIATLMAARQPIGDQLAGWIDRPLAILDGPTSATFVVVLAVWWMAVAAAQELGELRALARSQGLVPPLQRIVRRYLFGLFIGVVATAGYVALTESLHAGVGLAVIGYAIGGLVAVGRIRLASLQARWTDQGIDVSPEVGRRFGVATALLIGAATVAALALPTPTGIGIVEVAVAIAVGVGTLFSRIFAPGEAPDGPIFEFDPEDPFFDPFPEAEDGVGSRELIDPVFEMPAWIGDVWQVLAWAFAAAVVIWLVATYLRERPDLLARLRLPALGHTIRRLGALLRRFFAMRWLRRVWADAGDLLSPARRRRRRPDREPTRSSAPRLPSGGPRQELLMAYLEIIETAERRGHPRVASETPYEYEETLGRRLHAAHLELDRLTEAFVDARYSIHIVDEARATRARRDAEQVLAALEAGTEGDESDERRTDQRPGGPTGDG
jgi:hypothetical protein